MKSYDEWLIDNLSGKEGTLIFYLHENGHLDFDELDDFYNIANAMHYRLLEETCRPLTIARLYAVYSLILKYFACHFDSDDGYLINNLSSDVYCDVMDKLQSVFDIRKLR